MRGFRAFRFWGLARASLPTNPVRSNLMVW